MPQGLSRRIETVVKEATEAHDRTTHRDVRYLNHYYDDAEVHVEAGVTDAGGAEAIINYADALSRAMLNIADGRTVSAALVVGDTLARWTIDESHADLEGDELRARLIPTLRVD